MCVDRIWAADQESPQLWSERWMRVWELLMGKDHAIRLTAQCLEKGQSQEGVYFLAGFFFEVGLLGLPCRYRQLESWKPCNIRAGGRDLCWSIPHRF